MKARKMRSWRNWQTRKTKDLVGNSMQVQFLSTAPKKRKLIKFNLRFCFYYRKSYFTNSIFISPLLQSA